MLRILTASALAPEEMTRLFDQLADDLDEAAGRGDTVRIVIEPAGPPGDSPAPAAGAFRAVLRAAGRLERSLGRLHAAGGALVCHTRGTAGGAYLEIALMSDAHVMEPSATLAPAGLFDRHIPCAGGWSRLIERTGPGRAATLLLSRRTVTAPEALAAGLCDQIGLSEETADGARDEAPASSVALRLAAEMSERAGRGGGLTPRQTRVLESASFALAFASGDPREGIAAFFEGRPARFGLPDRDDHPDHP